MSRDLSSHRQPWRRGRNAGSQTFVWSSVVVVNCPFSGQHAQMALIQGNEPIQTLPPQAADQPLAIGVGLRRPNGSFQNFDSQGFDGAIQVFRENARTIVDQPAVRVITGNSLTELLQGP